MYHISALFVPVDNIHYLLLRDDGSISILRFKDIFPADICQTNKLIRIALYCRNEYTPKKRKK